MLCACVCERDEEKLERPLSMYVVRVCVFHYDYFPVGSFFPLPLLLFLLPLLQILSSSRQARQPSSHMCRLLSFFSSSSSSLPLSSSNAQLEQQANELISSRSFSSLFSPVFNIDFFSVLLRYDQHPHCRQHHHQDCDDNSLQSSSARVEW